MYLVLVRHGESIWNKENRFTGWTDVELSEKGIEEAKEAGKKIAYSNIDFDISYTSLLKRAQDTLTYICKCLTSTPKIIADYRLNERHYGALQGLNKDETRKRYGIEQVMLWRRSFATRPPQLDKNDKTSPYFDPKYKGISKEKLPLAESLEDTLKRVTEIFEEDIAPKLKKHNILVVAHGNSLRALIKYLENISDDDIVNLEIPTGKPILYELDENLTILGKEFL